MKSLVILAAIVLGSRAGYLNNLDGPLHFQCPPRQSVYHVDSKHDNGAEDRQFYINCTGLADAYSGAAETCYWTANYVNDLDQPFAFSCPSNDYIAGMDSVHDNGAEDRRWKFRCCALEHHHLEDCLFSGFVNRYDQPFNYNVPGKMVMRGVISIHNNGPEDRIYDFEYCKLHYFLEEVAVG